MNSKNLNSNCKFSKFYEIFDNFVDRQKLQSNFECPSVFLGQDIGRKFLKVVFPLIFDHFMFQNLLEFFKKYTDQRINELENGPSSY